MQTPPIRTYTLYMLPATKLRANQKKKRFYIELKTKTLFVVKNITAYCFASA